MLAKPQSRWTIKMLNLSHGWNRMLIRKIVFCIKKMLKKSLLEIQQLLFINRKESNSNPDCEYLHWIGQQIRGTHLRILKNPRSGKIWETATGKRKEVLRRIRLGFRHRVASPALLCLMWTSPCGGFLLH